eukprot:5378705-Alexandrium_andersonii.AAC.1
MPVEKFIRRAAVIALAFDMNGGPRHEIFEFAVRRFGSRCYGGALPSSDIDLIVELPKAIF